jgi:serine/threonine-protein kinase
MSPEQARGHEVSARTDVYAMGVVAYELLTGNVPFSCESAVETLMMQVDVVPKPAGELEPSIPDSLEKLIARMLSKRPEDRPASAAEVKRELIRIKKQLTNAETQIASAVQVRDEEPKTAPPGTKRYETTDEMAPLDDAKLGARPSTARTARARTQRSWLIPALLGGVGVVLGTAYFVTRPAPVRPLPAELAVQAPLPPARAEPKVSPPPEPVQPPAQPPTPIAVAKKLDAPAPKKSGPRHSREDVQRRIGSIRSTMPPGAEARLRKAAMDAFEQRLKQGESPDTLWEELRTY